MRLFIVVAVAIFILWATANPPPAAEPSHQEKSREF